MTPRKRNYFAKSNRGKGPEVFVHNFFAASASGKKREKEEKLRHQSAYERQRKRDGRVREKLKERREKDQQKFDKLSKLAHALCHKYDLWPEVAEDIAHRAYEECVPPSRMEQQIVKHYRNEWITRNHEVSLDRFATKLLALDQDRIMLERFALETAKELLGQDIPLSDLATHPAVERAFKESSAVLKALDQQILDFDFNQRGSPAISVNKEPV